MIDVNAVEGVLNEMKKTSGIEDIVLVSRSGMHIAGKVPTGAHTETFSAMFAILLGAAETATSEINQKLDHVLISLGATKMLVVNNGPKALYVMKLSNSARVDDILKEVERTSKKLEEHI